MKNYKFTAVCKSGQTKTFEFQASNYNEARAKLNELIQQN